MLMFTFPGMQPRPVTLWYRRGSGIRHFSCQTLEWKTHPHIVYEPFILLVIPLCALHSKPVMGRKSPSTWLYVILLLCQLANPLLSLHFIHTYVKCWQPHDNSLFSVDISIQEVLNIILGCLFF